MIDVRRRESAGGSLSRKDKGESDAPGLASKISGQLDAGGDVLRRQAFRPFNECELDLLAFVQRLVAIGLDRRIVNEDVVAGRARDEPIPLGRVEPLYSS